MNNKFNSLISIDDLYDVVVEKDCQIIETSELTEIYIKFLENYIYPVYGNTGDKCFEVEAEFTGVVFKHVRRAFAVGYSVARELAREAIT